MSVAQKTKGYLAGDGNAFTPDLLKAIDFVDASLGKVVCKLESEGIYENTLIIIASKHGQAPIDPTKYEKISPKAVTNATKVEVAFQTVCSTLHVILLSHH